MKKLIRENIVSNEAYAEERATFREFVLEEKKPRRIHVGDYLTFLFENTDTMRYQVQEMLRVEGRSGEEDIAHEMSTYNELLGDDGELGCTLLIEIDDPLKRDLVLRKWLKLPEYLYLLLEDGTTARAVFDERQVGEDRLSSVQYLKFRCGESAPKAIGIDMPDLDFQVDLSEEQASALRKDLSL